MRTRFVSDTRLMICVDPISEKAGPDDIRKETDPDANFLLVTKGGVLDLDVADRFGLINSEYDAEVEAVAGPSGPRRKGKAKAKEENKEGGAEEDADDKSGGAGGDGAEPLA